MGNDRPPTMLNETERTLNHYLRDLRDRQAKSPIIQRPLTVKEQRQQASHGYGLKWVALAGVLAIVGGFLGVWWWG